jgi:hypothetical protein
MFVVASFYKMKRFGRQIPNSAHKKTGHLGPVFLRIPRQNQPDAGAKF